MASETSAALPPAGPRRSGRRRRLAISALALAGAAVLLVPAFFLVSGTTGTHTLGSVAYAQVPPAGGDHSPVWQRCGFYAEPVRDEHAVHSLEHGAVWVTYRPDLPRAQIDGLRELARAEADLLFSPFPDLPAPVVVSAWGRQVRLDAGAAPRVAQAVADIRNGPPAPEPGGGCDGPNLWLTGATGNSGL